MNNEQTKIDSYDDSPMVRVRVDWQMIPVEGFRELGRGPWVARVIAWSDGDQLVHRHNFATEEEAHAMAEVVARHGKIDRRYWSLERYAGQLIDSLETPDDWGD